MRLAGMPERLAGDAPAEAVRRRSGRRSCVAGVKPGAAIRGAADGRRTAPRPISPDRRSTNRCRRRRARRWSCSGRCASRCRRRGCSRRRGRATVEMPSSNATVSLHAQRREDAVVQELRETLCPMRVRRSAPAAHSRCCCSDNSCPARSRCGPAIRAAAARRRRAPGASSAGSITSS